MSDTVGWMVEMSRGKKVDYVAAQLSLTVAAIHATTEALTCAMADLVAHPSVIHELRQEIIQVVGEAGWTKQALYKMKLMDSFLKESQRIHPVSLHPPLCPRVVADVIDSQSSPGKKNREVALP